MGLLLLCEVVAKPFHEAYEFDFRADVTSKKKEKVSVGDSTVICASHLFKVQPRPLERCSMNRGLTLGKLWGGMILKASKCQEGKRKTYRTHFLGRP